MTPSRSERKTLGGTGTQVTEVSLYLKDDMHDVFSQEKRVTRFHHGELQHKLVWLRPRGSSPAGSGRTSTRGWSAIGWSTSSVSFQVFSEFAKHEEYPPR